VNATTKKIDYIVANNFEWAVTMSYKVNDWSLDSQVKTIIVNADKKAPAYFSHSVDGLITQWAIFSEKTITVKDFSNIASVNIQILDLFGWSAAGASISSIDINNDWANPVITFAGVLPNIEDAKIVATFTDIHGNVSASKLIKTLNLSVANTVPTATDLNITTDVVDTHTHNLAWNIDDAETSDSWLTINIISWPSHWSLTWNSNTEFVYEVTDGSGYNWPDSFTYEVEDPNGWKSQIKTVSFTAVFDF
jgi:hypothetical protein